VNSTPLTLSAPRVRTLACSPGAIHSLVTERLPIALPPEVTVTRTGKRGWLFGGSAAKFPPGGSPATGVIDQNSLIASAYW
jgi:hypothetical protein